MCEKKQRIEQLEKELEASHKREVALIRGIHAGREKMKKTVVKQLTWQAIAVKVISHST